MSTTQRHDLTSPAFHADPVPVLDRMRADGRVVATRLPIIGAMRLATTHAACAELLKDHDRFVRPEMGRFAHMAVAERAAAEPSMNVALRLP